jgi:hypothetical protein
MDNFRVRWGRVRRSGDPTRHRAGHKPPCRCRTPAQKRFFNNIHRIFDGGKTRPVSAKQRNLQIPSFLKCSVVQLAGAPVVKANGSIHSGGIVRGRVCVESTGQSSLQCIANLWRKRQKACANHSIQQRCFAHGSLTRIMPDFGLIFLLMPTVLKLARMRRAMTPTMSS